MAASNMDHNRRAPEPRIVTDQHFRYKHDKAKLIKTRDGWQTTLRLDQYVWEYINHFYKSSLRSIRAKLLVSIQHETEGENVVVNLFGTDRNIVSLAEQDILLLQNETLKECRIIFVPLKEFPSMTGDIVRKVCASVRQCQLTDTGKDSYAIVGPKKEIHKVIKILEKSTPRRGKEHLLDMGLRHVETGGDKDEGRCVRPVPEGQQHVRNPKKTNIIKTGDGWQSTLPLDEYAWQYIQHFNKGSFRNIRYKLLINIKAVKEGSGFLVTLSGIDKNRVSMAEKEILELHNKAMDECGINHFGLDGFPDMTDSMVRDICASFPDCRLIDTGRGSYAIVGPTKDIHIGTKKLEKAVCGQVRHSPRSLRHTGGVTDVTKTESDTTIGEAIETQDVIDPIKYGLSTAGCSGSDNGLPMNRFAGNYENSQQRITWSTKGTCHGKSETTNRAIDKKADESGPCPVCMEPVGNPKKLICGHTFCTACISTWFSDRPVCPVCGRAYGNQPEGKMIVGQDTSRLPGFENSSKGTIVIKYKFLPGVQLVCHPHPGHSYEGFCQQAYLPNNPEGRMVLALLQKAFGAKLTFTIGQVGSVDQVTWNDIHHKTATSGGLAYNGYPDENYLSRVRKSLAEKGIR